MVKDALAHLVKRLEGDLVNLHCEEVVLEVQDQGGWISEDVADSFLERVSRGSSDFTFAAPSAFSFSRLTGSSLGAPAVRIRAFPFGKPNLPGALTRSLTVSNELRLMMFKVLAATANGGSAAWNSKMGRFSVSL